MTGTETSRRRVLAVTLAAVVTASAVTAVPGVALFAGTVSANAPSTIAVAQGTNCYTVQPVGNGSETVEAFYDYRNPENSNEPGNTTYSSFGTTEFQETGASSLFFYDGANGTSLVVVHDQTGDEDGGSTITWSLSGLPSGGELAVQDDYYENQPLDDEWNYSNTTADVDWKYADNRTDGAAFRGLDGENFTTITIDPGYNEAADYWGEWDYSGSEEYEVTDWTVRESGGEVVSHLALDQRVFVHHDACGTGAAPNASLDGDSSTRTGDPINLTASNTTDGDGNVAGYEWDLDGDGDPERTTETPEITHAFDSGGTETVTVTAFDTYANHDSAALDVTVVEPPNASLSAPDLVSPNETVTLDASNSTDDDGVDEYRWDLDGDGVVDRNTSDATTTTSYNETGDRTVSVTVVDAQNATDTATATVSVEPDSPPTAALSVTDEAEVGEPVSLDASDSSDDRDIEEYRWDFDGDGEAEDTTDGDQAATNHTYESTGNYTPTVTVVDDAGQTANASASLSVVTANEPPTADLAVPESAATNETVALNASASTDGDGTIESYEWDFGDGDSETTENATVEHAYDEAGEYHPSVTVTDDDGADDEATATVDVAAGNETPTLSAAIDASPDEVEPGDSVTFDGSGSTPPDAITSYEWQFGDGETATGKSVDHAYDAPGTYTVELTVNGSGAGNETTTATASLEVAVDEADDGDSGSGGGGSGGSGGGGGGGSGGGGSGGGGGGGGSGGSGSDEARGGGPEPEPDFEVGELNVTNAELLAGQNATFTVEISNTGDAAGATNVTFTLDGEVLATETVHLGAGENTTVTVSHRFETAGAYEVTAENAGRVEVDVTPADPRLSVTDVAASAGTVASGDQFRVNATVENTGGRVGSMDVELELFGEVVAVETVSVSPGETRTVSFTRQLVAPGEYTASVAGQRVTVTVVDDSDDATTTTGSDDAAATVPGFTLEAGLLAALVALAGAAVARREP